ncbi:hypothetical protein BGX26_009573, partial [Mortierella sp. AD094]
NQSELSKNSSVRYVLRGSFRTNGVRLHLNAIKTRIFAEHNSWAEDRHKPDMNLMHDPREGYDCYLRKVQNMFPDKNAVLSIFGDNSTNEHRPWADIDVLALGLGDAFA